MRVTTEQFNVGFSKYFINDNFQRLEDIENDPSFQKNIKLKLKDLGYRFPKKGAKVVVDAIELFKEKYGFDFDKYLAQANLSENLNNNFKNDPFLKIKNVAFKVRDLGLSIFSKDYIAVDTHVIRTISRTGLIVNSYLYGKAPFSNFNVDYLDTNLLLRKLAKEANVPLGELDRALWHFGRSICTKKSDPNCYQCPLSKICWKNKKWE